MLLHYPMQFLNRAGGQGRIVQAIRTLMKVLVLKYLLLAQPVHWVISMVCCSTWDKRHLDSVQMFNIYIDGFCPFQVLEQF